jgi:hypothetical protein
MMSGMIKRVMHASDILATVCLPHDRLLRGEIKGDNTNEESHALYRNRCSTVGGSGFDGLQ